MNKETAKQILTKIYDSGYFSAEIDQKLLQYLIDNTLNGNVLKEVDIAKDIFGRDEDFNPSDSSIVRSHIYSIRKKLQTYYLAEGANDEIRLFLPKGHYKVEFKINSERKIAKIIKWKPFYYFFLIIIILTSVSIYFWYKNQILVEQNKFLTIVEENNAIWKDFLQSDLSTILVIGDYYVFQRPYKLNESELFIRDVEINSKQDFEKYLEKSPEAKAKYIQTPLTYLGMEVPYIVEKLTKVFRGDENRLKIKLASDLVWQDVQKNNIIFVGSEKTLRNMRFFLDKLRYKVNLFPHKIFYSPEHTDTVETYSLESYYRYGFHDDFPIVAKFPTTDKTTVMLMISFSSFGKIEMLKELTSSSFIDKLTNDNFIEKNMPPYFEILFKVHGVERTGFNTDILHFHEITSKIIIENNE
ncbi:MAG: helix-turn-helix domain-containing protein [Bacteroidetes bacterium]|nr:helix-turn-helix domain-containing protein [Bacteroidota bacterium]